MSLEERFQAFKAEAEVLAGGILEIPRRVLILLDMYHHSGGNHTFPLIAAHGALWAFGYFEAGGSLGRVIAKRYFYNSTERIYRMGLLHRFAEDFRRVNRQVCVDTWTNYRFAAECGHLPGAEKFVPQPLLGALTRIHAARAAGETMPTEERRQIFEHSFHCEQERTVAPGVLAAVNAFECRIMQFLCLHPLVRFSYFPTCRYLMFRNFAAMNERIEKGLKAWDIAAQRGWAEVENCLGLYGVMAPEQLAEPSRHLADLREQIVRQGQVIAASGS